MCLVLHELLTPQKACPSSALRCLTLLAHPVSVSSCSHSHPKRTIGYCRIFLTSKDYVIKKPTGGNVKLFFFQFYVCASHASYVMWLVYVFERSKGSITHECVCVLLLKI